MRNTTTPLQLRLTTTPQRMTGVPPPNAHQSSVQSSCDSPHEDASRGDTPIGHVRACRRTVCPSTTRVTATADLTNANKGGTLSAFCAA
jgi:hypothetical protein